MNIGEAIEAIKQGEKVRRAGWIDRDRWVAYEQSSIAKIDQFNAPPNRSYIEELGGTVETIAFFTMKKPDGGIMYGWSPTQTDLDATDWYVVPVDRPDPNVGIHIKTAQGTVTMPIIFDRPAPRKDRMWFTMTMLSIISVLLAINVVLFINIWLETDQLIDTMKACTKP